MAAKHIIYIGPHTLDLVPLQGKLIDYEEGGMIGLRTDMPGFQAMALSLAEAVPAHGAAAGIPQDVYDHFVMCNENVATIDERLAIAMKQVEVLKESRAFYIDARQNDIGLMVDAIRSRAQRRKDQALLIPFEPMVRYNGQIGEKALRTRKRNEQASAEAEAEAQGDTEAPVTQPTQPAQPA
jgi:hypothetical protein